MRVAVLILTAVAALGAITPVRAQEKPNPGKEERPKAASKVKELQRERIAVLQSLVDVNTTLFQRGRAPFEGVLEARELLFEARLATAEKEPDRIALYKELVDALRQAEAAAKGRLESGRATEAEILRIRARRLQAEIHLSQRSAKAPEQKQSKIIVTTPLAKDVVISEHYVGQIHAQRNIRIRSLETGYLQEVLAREGQAVKQGDVLFRIAPVLYKARLDAERAEARIVELDYRNTEKLRKSNVVSQDEVELVQAKLAKAQARVKLAEAELNFTAILAPFDGMIARIHEQQGSLITERDVLTTLSDSKQVWVYFNVPESRYLQVAAGAWKDDLGKVELVLANSTPFAHPGHIGAIEAQFNDKTGSISFRADFPNPDGLLRHGMSGTVAIHRTLKNAIVIPERAAFEVLENHCVYVVDKDDVAHQRKIVIQHELPGELVLKSGLAVGDRIIVDGAGQVHEGEKVEYEVRPPDQISGQYKAK